MKTLEEYIKTNHPEILDEYNKYAKEAKIIDKEKEEKEKANYRTKHKFWEFEFDYTFKKSIYDEDGEDEYIPFSYAFNLFSDDELADKFVIIKPSEEGYENGKTLTEIIKDAGVTKSYFKKEFKKFLYKEDPISLWMYVDKKHPGHYHTFEITWSGTYYWDKSHYEEIWTDLNNCRFIEKELEENF